MVSQRIKHVSIIMDGNGRWANERNMPRSYGHRKGIDAVKKIINACLVRQISMLTLFAFSSENWIRPSKEITLLMSLFRESILNNMSNLHNNNIKVKFIGDMSKFDRNLIKHISDLEHLTHDNDGLELYFAVNYGGKWDIVNAVNHAIDNNEDITPAVIDKYLSTKIDYPDLIVRTGGYKRLSNFMLWQAAYSELVFLDILWPDLTKEHIQSIFNQHVNTKRKFGIV